MPAPSHSTVSSEAAVIVGLVVSSMVKVAVDSEKFPQASVALKVTVADPVAPQSSLKAVKLFDQTKPQLSVAVAPPLEANQAFKAAVLPAPSHSTVWLVAAIVIEGLTVSCTVMVLLQSDVQPVWLVSESESTNCWPQFPVFKVTVWEVVLPSIEAPFPVTDQT